MLIRKVKHYFLFTFCLLSALFLSCNQEEEIRLPKLNPPILSLVGPLFVKVSVNIPDYGTKEIIERGIVWSDHETPTLSDFKLVGVGKPTTDVDTIKTLNPNTEYYFRSYVTDVDNATFFSNEASIFTSVHSITSYSPASASQGMSVSILGSGFVQGISVYFNDTPASSLQILPNSISAVVPFGLDVDSVIVGVELGSTRLSFPKKMGYKRGRWNSMQPISSDPNFNFYTSHGTTDSNYGYVCDGSTKSLFKYSPSTGNWGILAQRPKALTGSYEYKMLFAFSNSVFFVDKNQRIISYRLNTGEWDSLSYQSIPILGWLPFEGVSFTIGGLGYAGLNVKGGTTTPTKELWKFSPTGGWVKLNDFPGQAFNHILTLVSGNYVYFIGGFLTGGTSVAETWRYNPADDTWEKKKNYPGNGKEDLGGFTIDGKLYIGTGSPSGVSETTATDDFWEYDPSTDTWKTIANFIKARESVYSFSINNKGYLGGGYEPCVGGPCGYRRYDLFEFQLK